MTALDGQLLPFHRGNVQNESTTDLDSLASSFRSLNRDSIRSVQSISILQNKDASQTMPRNEELTMDLYALDPSNPVSAFIFRSNRRNRSTKQVPMDIGPKQLTKQSTENTELTRKLENGADHRKMTALKVKSEASLRQQSSDAGKQAAGGNSILSSSPAAASLTNSSAATYQQSEPSVTSLSHDIPNGLEEIMDVELTLRKPAVADNTQIMSNSLATPLLGSGSPARTSNESIQDIQRNGTPLSLTGDSSSALSTGEKTGQQDENIESSISSNHFPPAATTRDPMINESEGDLNFAFSAEDDDLVESAIQQFHSESDDESETRSSNSANTKKRTKVSPENLSAVQLHTNQHTPSSEKNPSQGDEVQRNVSSSEINADRHVSDQEGFDFTAVTAEEEQLQESGAPYLNRHSDDEVDFLSSKSSHVGRPSGVSSSEPNASMLERDRLVTTTARGPYQSNDRQGVKSDKLNRTQPRNDKLTPVNSQRYSAHSKSQDDDNAPYVVATNGTRQGSTPMRWARNATPESAMNSLVDEGNLHASPNKSRMKRRDNYRDTQRTHSIASSSDMTISFDSMPSTGASSPVPRLYDGVQPVHRHEHRVGSNSTLTGDERPSHKVVTIHGRDRIRRSTSEIDNDVIHSEKNQTTPQLLMYEPHSTASPSSFTRAAVYSDNQPEFRRRTADDPRSSYNVSKPRSARLNHSNRTAGTDKQTQHSIDVANRSTATTDFPSDRSKYSKNGRSLSSDRITKRDSTHAGGLTVDVQLPDSNELNRSSEQQGSRSTSRPAHRHYRQLSPNVLAADMSAHSQNSIRPNVPTGTLNEHSARLFVNGSQNEQKDSKTQTEKKNHSETTTQTRRRPRSLLRNNGLTDSVIGSYSEDQTTGANGMSRSTSLTSPRYNRLNKTMSDSPVRRAFIKQPSVSNRRHKWRTEDMPATDTEDFTEFSKRSSGKRQHIAHIVIGDDTPDGKQVIAAADSDDALSVFSEPVHIKQSKPSVSLFQRNPPVEIQQSPILAQSYPSPVHVPMASSLKFQPIDTAVNLVSHESSVESSIAAVDPELKDARKSGTNYHITLTLSPLMSYNECSTPKLMHSESSVPLLPLNNSYQSYKSPAPTLQPTTYQVNDSKTSERPRLISNASVVQIGSMTAQPNRQPSRQEIRRSNSQVEFDIEVESLPGTSDHEDMGSLEHRNNPRFEVPLHSKLSINYNPLDDPHPKASSVRSGQSTLKHQQQTSRPANKSPWSNTNAAASRPNLFGNIRPDGSRYLQDASDDYSMDFDDECYQSTEMTQFDPYDDLPRRDEYYDQHQAAERSDNEAVPQMSDGESIGSMSNNSQESEPETHRPFFESPVRNFRPQSRESYVQTRCTPVEFTQPQFTSNDDDFNEAGGRFRDSPEELAPHNFTCEDDDTNEAGMLDKTYPSSDDDLPTIAATVPGDDKKKRQTNEVNQPQFTFKDEDNQYAGNLRNDQKKRQTNEVNQPQFAFEDEDNQYAGNLRNADSYYKDLPDSSSRRLDSYKADSDHETRQLNATTEDNQRWSRQALEVRRTYEQGEFDSEIQVSRGTLNRRSPANYSSQQPTGRESVTAHELIETLDATTLFYGAPVTSVRQTIDVERLEDEILTEKPVVTVDGQSATANLGLTTYQLDYETVSEEIVMDVTASGHALTTARVRCERIVPIRGSDEMYKKSSVIVTRRIEVDLTVTPTRRHLLKAIAGVHTTIQGSKADPADGNQQQNARLSEPDAFKLYQKFLALAEMSKTGVTK